MSWQDHVRTYLPFLCVQAIVNGHLTGLFRATNVLVHYRGFVLPEGPRFRAYLDRLFNDPAFKATCSTEDLYIDSYER